LCHGGNDILSWMAANYTVRHGARGDVRPDKQKAADKIDGQVALDMAIARWIPEAVVGPSVYASRGALVM
jgi:phage terminase large subunit-like protein